tara:strand:- start:9440 stop:10099 length:660 start_codon:yes stop_codon:yes gene_type:complete
MAFQFNKQLSLYIPSVLKELASNEGVRHYLQRFGHIKAVDIVSTNKDGVYKAFVHFNEWYDDKYSRDWQKKVMDAHARAELDIGNGYFLLLPKRKMQTQKENSLPPMPEKLQPLLYPQRVDMGGPRFGGTYQNFSDMIDMFDDEIAEVNHENWKAQFPPLPKTPPPSANSSNNCTPRGVNNLPAWMTEGTYQDQDTDTEQESNTGARKKIVWSEESDDE